MGRAPAGRGSMPAAVIRNKSVAACPEGYRRINSGSESWSRADAGCAGSRLGLAIPRLNRLEISGFRLPAMLSLRGGNPLYGGDDLRQCIGVGGDDTVFRENGRSVSLPILECLRGRRRQEPKSSCADLLGMGTRQKCAVLLERAKGFEPSTPTLARSCSTPELHPHPFG